MFKKLKLKIDQCREENATFYADTISSLQDRMQGIDQIADAGARYLALDEFKKDIYLLDKVVEDRIYSQIHRDVDLFDYTRLASGIFVLIAGFTAGFTFAGTPGFATGVIYSLSSMIPFNPIKELYNKNLRPDCNNFFSGLKKMTEAAAKKQELILKNDIRNLGVSSCFEQVYDSFPAVREAFVRNAFIKRPVGADKEAEINTALRQPVRLIRKINTNS